MSKSLGTVNHLHANKFWGGIERGSSLQLSDNKSGFYVQLNAAEIIALMPAFKDIIDTELNRQKKECEKMLAKYKELEKSIVSDMRAVSEMAINQPALDAASLLVLGGAKLIVDENEAE